MNNKKLDKARIENRLYGRRQFLISAAGTILTLPPLLSLMPEKLAAQVISTSVKRAVIYVGGLGIDPHQFFPINQSDLIEIPDEVSGYYKELEKFKGQSISRVIDRDFEEIYSYMNIYQGLSLTGGSYMGHNNSVLSGTHSGGRDPKYGKSMDVVLAQSSSVYGANDSFVDRAIRVGIGNQMGMSFDRVNGERKISSSLIGDQQLFNKLFAGLSSEVPSSMNTDSFSNDKLIVDQVYNDLKQLEKNPRLSIDDKRVLDKYISGVFDLQSKIKAGAPVSCGKPTIGLEASASGNTYQFPYDSKWQVENVSRVYDNINEMITLAFTCDLTRVVVIGGGVWNDMPIAPSTDGGLHHECPSSEAQADRQKWMLKKLLNLAKTFKATNDVKGEGNLLDNSVILATNELGAWTTSHNIFNLPTFTIGNCGGSINSGYFLDYRQKPLRKVKGYEVGRPFKQILQTIMASMGVEKSEYSQFGDGKGFGEFNPRVKQFGLDSDLFSQYGAVHNDPLKFVFKK